MRHMEQCLEALAQTSMTAKQKFALLAMGDDFVFGHALRATADPIVDLDFATAQSATGKFPRIAEVFGKGRIGGGKDRFPNRSAPAPRRARPASHIAHRKHSIGIKLNLPGR